MFIFKDITVFPPVTVYVLFHGNAGMSEAECDYFCHMNYICSVFIQLMALYSSCAEKTGIKWFVKDLKIIIVPLPTITSEIPDMFTPPGLTVL